MKTIGFRVVNLNATSLKDQNIISFPFFIGDKAVFKFLKGMKYRL